MSDVSVFLESYNKALQEEISGADIPPEVKEQFTFESLEKKKERREVYFVTRKSDNKRGVLRITDADSHESAASEGEVLSRLDHPSIPKILGSWAYNGRSFLVREHFEGDDLRTYVRKFGPLSVEKLTDITLRLCDVLTYIHTQNPPVIHRDIKPENIILSSGGEVKLIDFGIARQFREKTKSDESDRDTKITGTKPYMAPEQFGSEQTDNRADLYSLGVVMIFLSTGKPAWKNLKSVYPYKRLIPLIQRCIRKDRSQRYKTAEQLKRRILWTKRRMTGRILLCTGVIATVAAAFLAGLFLGRIRGFKNGVDSIMDVPVKKYELFSPEELWEQITFDNWYLDVAVRMIVGAETGKPIYRDSVVTCVRELYIYGNFISHPFLEKNITKMHIGKGAVIYYINGFGNVNERGDISALTDIPNMYYLKTLELTSQNISDLTPLGGMKIVRLVLCDNFIGNLLPLKDMATLKELDLCENPLRDLTPIRGLLSLCYLDVSQTSVTDLAPLSEMLRLETLNLAYCDVNDLRPLAKLGKLKEVDVSHTAVKDLRPLVRDGDPVTVICAGLPEEAIDAVRGMNIVLVEEPKDPYKNEE